MKINRDKTNNKFKNKKNKDITKKINNSNNYDKENISKIECDDKTEKSEILDEESKCLAKLNE